MMLGGSWSMPEVGSGRLKMMSEFVFFLNRYEPNDVFEYTSE
jgi:hypothetical protein